MSRTASKDVPPTFQQLKERGDRAIAEARETVLRLRASAHKSTELRDQITWLHHLDLKLPAITPRFFPTVGISKRK
jgi:hypothetical protein